MLSILPIIFILLMRSNGERTLGYGLHNTIQSFSTECMACTGATAVDAKHLARGRPCIGETQAVYMYCIYRHRGIFNETSLVSEEDIYNIYNSIVQTSEYWNEKVLKRMFHVCWRKANKIKNENLGKQAATWHNCLVFLLQNEQTSQNNTTQYREGLLREIGENYFKRTSNEKCSCEDMSGISHEESSGSVNGTYDEESTGITNSSQENSSQEHNSAEVAVNSDRSVESHPHSSESVSLNNTEYSTDKLDSSLLPSTSDYSNSSSIDDGSSTESFYSATDISTDSPSSAHPSNTHNTSYAERYTSTTYEIYDLNFGDSHFNNSENSTGSSNPAHTTENLYLTSTAESTHTTTIHHGHSSESTFHQGQEKSTSYFPVGNNSTRYEGSTEASNTSHEITSEDPHHYANDNASEIYYTTTSEVSISISTNPSHQHKESTSSVEYTNTPGSSHEHSSEKQDSEEIWNSTRSTDLLYTSERYVSTYIDYGTNTTDLSTVRISQGSGSKEEEGSTTTPDAPHNHGSETSYTATIYKATDTQNTIRENSTKNYDSTQTEINTSTQYESNGYTFEVSHSTRTNNITEVTDESNGHHNEGHISSATGFSAYTKEFSPTSVILENSSDASKSTITDKATNIPDMSHEKWSHYHGSTRVDETTMAHTNSTQKLVTFGTPIYTFTTGTPSSISTENSDSTVNQESNKTTKYSHEHVSEGSDTGGTDGMTSGAISSTENGSEADKSTESLETSNTPPNRTSVEWSFTRISEHPTETAASEYNSSTHVSSEGSSKTPTSTAYFNQWTERSVTDGSGANNNSDVITENSYTYTYHTSEDTRSVDKSIDNSDDEDNSSEKSKENKDNSSKEKEKGNKKGNGKRKSGSKSSK